MTTNSELLGMPASALGPLEGQRRFLSMMYREPIACSQCRNAHTQEEASGIPLDDVDWKGAIEPNYLCPVTEEKLDLIFPFIGPMVFVALIPSSVVSTTSPGYEPRRT